MKKLLSTTFFFAAAMALFQMSAEEVNIAEFGAIPDDNKNDIESFRAAANYCRANPSTTLLIPSGVYDFEDSLALKIEREAIGGAYGERVQQTLFRPDAPHVKAFDLSGCENLQIRGEGATFNMKGWYEVLTLDKAKNITIDGIAIRYHRPPNTVGEVIYSDSTKFDISFDKERYCYIDSTVTGRVHFYDSSRNRLYTGGATKKELTGPGRIRLHSTRQPAVGDRCILRHGGHYRPAIMIKESCDVTLRNVKIHSQPGMGVVGHMTENVTLDGVQIVPMAGDVISTNTDATHFTSCSGTVTIQNCKFRGQGDDCTNMHNYYYRIYPITDRKMEIRIEGADLHAQSPDYPLPGDSMLITDRYNLTDCGTFRVENVSVDEKAWKVIIELDRAPEGLDNTRHIMTNISRRPAVRIINNTVGSHLARAFLIKSRDVSIAGNYITGSTETAIKLGSEISWNESGPVEDVVIENNYISGCGYCGNENMPSCVITGTEARETAPQVNRNIIIRNNVFDSDKSCAILLKDACNVEIYGNSAKNINYVKTDNCSNFIIKE